MISGEARHALEGLVVGPDPSLTAVERREQQNSKRREERSWRSSVPEAKPSEGHRSPAPVKVLTQRHTYGGLYSYILAKRI